MSRTTVKDLTFKPERFNNETSASHHFCWGGTPGNILLARGTPGQYSGCLVQKAAFIRKH